MYHSIDRLDTSPVGFVGLISDTHGVIRPEALDALRGASVILHAGDIGAPVVLDRLGEIAPVFAVRGNNDHGGWARSLPDARTIDMGPLRVHLIHDIKELHGTVPPGAHIVIAGHSHRPSIEQQSEALVINPGSAGPRRFTLPVTVARLRLTDHRPTAEIIPLMPAPDPWRSSATKVQRRRRAR